ncbi:MAG: branched-chain amino acid ABC transporter permease [Dehalococcoidia bacterium]|nr:MAG: branched-chain amino acid ABC transporter permease [Dehalococcoidia bacterium]
MSIISSYAGRAYKGFRGEVLVLPSRTVVLLFCLILLLLPLVMAHPYYLRILIMASIFAIFAASWDLLSGFTGQISFGHALFFGVAAYTSALLNLNIGLPPWVTIPLGALAAVVAGLVVGVPCLRLRGTYLALATLAFPLILTGVVFVIPDITGGELGVSGIDRLFGSRVIEYYIAVTLMIGLGFVMWKITDSKTGIIFHAIREDEVAARASGINTTKYKLLAFCLSGFFAGIAGGLYVHFMRIAGPSTLELMLSFQVIIWVIFGGIATIYGPIAGAFILVLLMEFLTIAPEIRMLLFAIMVLLVLLFMPEGLITWVRDKIEKICPRCKLRNVATRKTCRVCTAELD